MALLDRQDQYSVSVKEMDTRHLKRVEMINELYRY